MPSWMKTTLFIGLFLSLKLTVIGGICFGVRKGISNSSNPPLNDASAPPLPSNRSVQAIITTYKFQCDCVNITSWETYVEPGDQNHIDNRYYDITFQVWRPSPTEQDNGWYSLVGENVFNSISFNGGGLVRLTPTPPTIITAQSGDVVGYYTNSRGGDNEGIQLESNGGYNKNVVWFISGSEGLLAPNGGRRNTDSYLVGAGGYLSRSTSAAPMLRIRSAMVTCPPLPSPSLSSSLQIPTATKTHLISPTSVSLTTESSLDIERTVTAMSLSFSDISSTKKISPSPTLSVNFGGPMRTTATMTSSFLGISSTEFLSPTSTIVNFGGPNATATNSVIPAVVVIVILLVIISILAVITIKMLLNRRASEKQKALNFEAVMLKTIKYPLVQATTMSVRERKDAKNTTKLVPNMDKRNATDESSDDVALDYSQVDSLDYTYPVLRQPHITETSFYSDEESSSAVLLNHGKGSSGGPHNIVGRNAPVEADYDSSSCTNYDMLKECGVYDVPLHPLASKSKRDFFTQNDAFWTPASTTAELYSQLATQKYCELPRDQIRLDKVIGAGHFGEVYKATWNKKQEKLELAVKTLKSGASEEDHIKFLQEAAIMGQFNHRNIVKMYGVVTLGKPVLICLEILDNGDLREYLLKMNPKGSKFEDFLETELVFLKFAKEIAAGMEYLSQKSFVHRDLAARNILLSKYLTCKIADFGMARDLMDDTYYTSSGGKIPVKWTAPEALLYKKYSTDSDVWSYGMVLFEIWSVGKKPFPAITNNQCMKLIQNGYCQAPPPGCPQAIYKLMVDCWNPDHNFRPSFSSICQKLNESPEKLLYWSPSDDSLSSQVGVCGAELSKAEELYSEIQNTYTNSSILLS